MSSLLRAESELECIASDKNSSCFCVQRESRHAKSIRNSAAAAQCHRLARRGDGPCCALVRTLHVDFFGVLQDFAENQSRQRHVEEKGIEAAV